MGVHLMVRGGVWYLEYIYSGRRVRKSLKVKVAKDAKDRRRQRLALEAVQLREAKRINEAVQNAVALRKVRVDFGLEDFDEKRQGLAVYAAKAAETSKSKKIIMQMVSFLNRFDKRGVSIGNVNVDFLERFKMYLLEDAGLKQKSACIYFRMLKFVMRRAVLDGIIAVNPCDKVKGIANIEVEKDVLTIEDIQALEDAKCTGKCGAEIKRAFLFACNTGLRHCDIQTLTWGDIESKGGEWLIHKTQQKTKRAVDIVLNSKARALIGAGEVLHFGSELVFSGLQGMGENTGNRTIKRWAKAAGVEKHITWHTARRTFATLLIEAGADVFTAQRLMGHSSISITSVYAKTSMAQKAKAVKALDKLESGGDSKESKKA